jgi:glycosyltransferase involved in cell wall biosynthesis
VRASRERVPPVASPAPLISIVTATYNRSHILRHALASAIRSTEADWELVVVGDGCTDDTGDLVASIGDPRVRFIDLPVNHGEQSGPNNVGCREARGRYIAFLNHDDLWMPHHLAALRRGLEEMDADLVFGMGIAVIPGGPNVLVCATESGEYEPHVFCPASSWLLRRELVERVGPWSSMRETYAAPSQAWLYRAWSSGARLRLVPEVTWVAIQSGWRRNSYVDRDDAEHRAIAARMEDGPAFLLEELTAIARHACAAPLNLGLWTPAKALLRNIVYRAAVAASVAPAEVNGFLRFRRKGGLIDRLRHVRGLSKLP